VPTGKGACHGDKKYEKVGNVTGVLECQAKESSNINLMIKGTTGSFKQEFSHVRS
jgi:hypothetical protein